MKPIVAIVGRPNVGKSTLFNKLLGRKKAIVFDEPGITRDLNYADTEEAGKAFTLVDTGGFEPYAEDKILSQVRDQARLAIEEADCIVFLMDGKVGLASQDEEIAGMLRRSGKPVVYAVNKIDSLKQSSSVADFFRLGIREPLAVSAENGIGLNELVDAILERLPEAGAEPEDADRKRIAIVGRPNVGKSSLLNRIIGKRRAIVSDVAGTTRDPIDTPFDFEGRKYLFVDTAGIRKKNRISLTVENYSVMEAIRSMERADCVLLVLDGKEGVQGQDEKIAGLIEDRKKTCVIIVNKWDIVEKDTHTTKHATATLRERFPFLSYAPVVFCSALTGQRSDKVLETAGEAMEQADTTIATSVLNEALGELTSRYRHPASRGREVKFFYITQGGVKPPTFLIFTNIPEGVIDSYRRYLVNGLREALRLDKVPIRLVFKQRQH